MFNSQLRIIDQLSKGYREREGVGEKIGKPAPLPPNKTLFLSLELV